jgi:hypothetical protein
MEQRLTALKGACRSTGRRWPDSRAVAVHSSTCGMACMAGFALYGGVSTFRSDILHSGLSAILCGLAGWLTNETWAWVIGHCANGSIVNIGPQDSYSTGNTVPERTQHSTQRTAHSTQHTAHFTQRTSPPHCTARGQNTLLLPLLFSSMD